MNDFGRLLEREIPRLRRYARALTQMCPEPMISSRTPSSARLRSRIAGIGVAISTPGSSPLCITRM